MNLATQSEAGTLRLTEHEELHGLARTVAEVHWLLIVLVLVYLLLGGVRGDALGNAAISSGLFFYGALVVAFRYAKLLRRETRWKIAIETLAMIALVTWAVRFTGGMTSPLANTYLLPVVTSALALGRVPTIIELVVIALCQAFVGADSVRELMSLPFAGVIITQFAPVAFVAYVTMVFSADVRHGLSLAKAQSQTDDLTDLYNRRGFRLLATRRLNRSVAENRPAGLLMIDSDNLKWVNDTHGHEAGNRLLRHLAQGIVAQLRASDIAGRYGGDEFVVFLPDTPPAGVLEAADRIRRAIAGSPLDFFGSAVTSTVSVGYACFPEDGASLDALLVQADRGLYSAKEQGRNRTVREPREAR
jgi:diguanylate cyclase (GGDEF)-like protein